MKTGNLRKFLILVILIALTSMFACSAGKDVYEVGSLAYDSFSNIILPDEKPVLKKKVLITPVINASEISSDQAEAIRQDCISYLSRDKYLLLTTLKNWDDNIPAYVLKEFGRVINPAYSESAEKMGINILLACVIHPIEVTKTRTGIWPFRRDSHKALLSLSLNALDTVNDTQIIYDVRTTNIKIDKFNSNDKDQWSPYYDLIRDKFSSMTKKLCSSSSDKLRKIPWQSKIRKDGGRFIINGGKDIGVTEDTVFELYKQGDPVDALGNTKYEIFGAKIGETRVRYLSENQTVLDVKTDEEYKEAAYVRVKRYGD